jgi:hypothetical protein
VRGRGALRASQLARRVPSNTVDPQQCHCRAHENVDDDARAFLCIASTPSTSTSNLWQPYNPANDTWGPAGQTATTLTPNEKWGELSFRDVDGRPVLAGANFYDQTPLEGPVEVHVGESPTSVFAADPTIVMSNDPRSPNFMPAPYGGYILPGSTLSNLGLFGSQWYGPPGAPVHYDVQDIQVNVEPTH